MKYASSNVWSCSPMPNAGLVLDEQQPVMARAEVLVDQPLEKHAFEPRQRRRPLRHRRDLAGVEMAQQIPLQVLQIQSRRASGPIDP